ncbi:MAG: hypothetical protein JWP57_2244 [Spirosoma sp.]|nr:hypothetical protein [Spirosoma sp.]
MRLTHSYKNNTTLHDLLTVLSRSIVAYVDRYSETFEALVRSGNPFGGNWLPITLDSTGLSTTKRGGNELVHVQQQINTLTQTVALLSNRVEQLSAQLSTGTNSTACGTPARLTGSANRSVKNPTNEIGINRYRTLQEKP